MNSQDIEYRPYRLHRCLTPFATGITILILIMIGYFLVDVDYTVLILAAMALAGGFFAKYFYDTSRIVVIFEKDGLRIINGSQYSHYYIPWKTFSYAYYGKNYKGYMFLVLSPKALEPQMIRRFINRGGLRRLCFDGVVVISIDNTQSVLQLKELIGNKVTHRTE